MRKTAAALVGLVVVAFTLAAAPAAPAADARPAWQRAPVIPNFGGRIKPRLLQDVNRGRRLKVRPRVFAKVGDSNTEVSQVLYGLACARARFESGYRLRKVIRRYNRVKVENERPLPDCQPSTSFSRRSAAAKSGSITPWQTWQIRDMPNFGYWQGPSDCNLDETPIDCELRKLHPRYVFVMSGTNDIGFDDYFGVAPGSRIGARLRPVVRKIRAAGAVPVLSTIPPILSSSLAWNGAKATNRGIWKFARKRKVPLINLWRAMVAPGMINFGLADDDLHLGVFDGGGLNPSLTPGPTTYRDSVDFRPGALRYGANRRNLIWLKTLRKLDRVVRGR